MKDNTMHFGKYKGRSTSDVAQNDPSYFIWACSNVKYFNPDREDIALAHRSKYKDLVKQHGPKSYQGEDPDNNEFGYDDATTAGQMGMSGAGDW